jgi:protein gp37
MAENSKIEWTDHTFNPWTGCTKVSPGCDHCYAEGWAKRAGFVKWGAGQPRRRTTEANWRKPLQWDAGHQDFLTLYGRRQRVFCSSLADVFDNEVPREWRVDLFRLILATPHLDWLLLTKRIGNAARMLQDVAECFGPMMDANDRYKPLPNVWIGATIVNQEEADRDIPKLLEVPARVRFLSMEPLLGAVNLRPYFWSGDDTGPLPGIDWVIVGGESGPKARPMNPHWARSLRDQCAAAGVPFLFKQWGEFAPTERSIAEVARSERKLVPVPTLADSFFPAALVDRVGKKAAGRMLDGVTHDGYPVAL